MEQLQCVLYLCEQRLKLWFNPDFCWQEIGKLEERLEAHLDALVVGGEEALELCKQQATEGESGELYAAICVYCRQGRGQELIDVLEALSPEDTEKQRAVTDALKHELPVAWQEDFQSLLESDTPHITEIIAELAGHRRLPVGRDLVRLLQQRPTVSVIQAIGRLREQSAAAHLIPMLNHDNKALASAAALSLLRLGDRDTVPQCLIRTIGESWTHLPLAFGGGPHTVEVLLNVARSDKATGDTLLAQGVLGESSAIDLLLNRLDGDLAASAALALNLITGAELYEQVFIREEIDEDELFPKELEAYRNEGKVPTRSDGTPYGEKVTRLSQSAEEWSNWWEKNSNRFQFGVRYRNGKPFSPACLLENLQHEKSPFRIRQLAYEELVIRYDADFHFEADMPVKEQLRALEEISNWLGFNAGRFQEGAWYFAGQPIPA